MRHHLRLALVVLCCLVLAGCGFGAPQQVASITPEPTNTPAPPTPTPTATPEPPTPTVEPTPTVDAAATPVTTEDLADEVNDTPELSTDAAPPTLQATPTPTNEELQPTRLVIPDIGLDTEPVAVGLDARRVPVVPKHDVGWYEYSAMPSRGENIVFWGHVSRWLDSPNIPAPFARLVELEIGDEITVYTANGDEHRYEVTEAVQVRPTQVEYILPTGDERVTLVSCIGDRVILDGVRTREFRLIVIAEPVDEASG
jgi:LPXTG-site transpeptidase (sortase) family protein